MIARPALVTRVRTALGRSPVTVLVGPRQCGKTTLAGVVGAGRSAVTRFDLEHPADLLALEHPAETLGRHRGLVIVDEVQRRPDLFPVLRVLADRRPLPARFLLLGSASPELLRQGSESLAGRVEIIEMGGFDLSEVGAAAAQRLWIRGGFPWHLAGELHPDVPRAGPPAARAEPAAADAPAVLDHGGALPRPDVERIGDRALARRQRRDDPALPRRPHGRLHDPPAPAVVRERCQASGPDPQGLRA